MEGAPWTQAVNLHIDRSDRKPRAPPSARMLATSPVATGEAKQEEPRKGTETRNAPTLQLVPAHKFKNQNTARGRKLVAVCKNLSAGHHFKTISPQGDGAYLQPPLPRRGRWHTQCAGGGAMDASRKPSIATEAHASHERPHRLALLATSPVATGEAKIGESPQGDGNIRNLSVRLK